MITVITYGIDSLMAKAEEMQSTLEKVVDDALTRVTEQAVTTARAFYASAVENPHVTVVAEHGFLDHSVVASGSDVVFAEFGAGLTTETGGYSLEMPIGIYPGSWSETHSRQFSSTGKWKHNGRIFTHILPTNAMYNAGLEMRQNIESGAWLA